MNPPLSLKQDDIHIWSAHLTWTTEQEAAFTALLNSAELARAHQYKVARAKSAFIAARGILRIILSQYLQLAPPVIEFSYGSDKKPLLAAKHASKLTFNVSHSHDIALFAIAYNQAIGIDVEKISPHAYLDVAGRFFSPEECAYLYAVPTNQQAASFHQLWTRKEAILKALGVGLRLPLNQFSVTNETEAIEIEKKWWFYKDLHNNDLPIPPDYCAAIASDKPLTRLVYWHFHDTLKG